MSKIAIHMRIAIINTKSFKMDDFRPEESSLSESSRRQIESHLLKRDESSQFALPSHTQRREWDASDRSASMDSGISELPSSPYGTPSPIMPHSPTRHRPNSGDLARHTRSPSQRSHRNIVHGHCNGPGDSSNSHTVSRPSSAFSNYSPLPHIGQEDICQEANKNTDKKLQKKPVSGNQERTTQQRDSVQYRQSSRPNSGTYEAPHKPPTPRPPSGKKISTRELRRQQFARRKSSIIDTSSIPNEPLENEPRILLAIKLPSGQRLQRYFHPTDSFVKVCMYAESESKQSFSNCNLYINQVPKRLIEKWKETFHEAGLVDRTLLCLEEKDD